MPKARQHDPWLPPLYTDRDAGSIQALARGDATPEQQAHALRYIVETIAACYDTSFRPGGQEGERATAFAEGRRFVGSQIVKLTKLNLAELRKINA